MPSGPKKRRAAKKKKEKNAMHHYYHHQQPNSDVGVHSHGDANMKHCDDDKDSAVEEVGSLASQEHPNNHHEEVVEKIEDRTNVQSSSEDNKYYGGLRDPEVPKSSDCQPSLPAAPQFMRRTSWLNCCGLFELFARCNR